MKHFILASLTLMLMACNNTPNKGFSEQALRENLLTIDGKTQSFGDIIKKHNGKPVLIEIWASWCGDCVKAMPKLKEAQAANPDVDYVFISLDKTPEKWKEGTEKHNLEGEHYFSPDGMKGSFGKSIDLDWIPRYIILDKNDDVAVYRAIETDFDQINSTLKNLAK